MGEVEMQRRVRIVLFEGFEVLDVFGPVELFGQLPERYRLAWVSPEPGPVRSAQGVEVMATESLDEAVPADIVLVPGGAWGRAGWSGIADSSSGSHLGPRVRRWSPRCAPAPRCWPPPACGGLPGDVEQEGLRVGIRSWPGRHMAPEGALGA